MIYSEILKKGSNFLKKNKIENPYLDTELILSKVTNKRREEILLNINSKLKDNDIYFENIGITQKEYFELDKDLKIKVKELYELNNRWYNKFNGLNS